MDANFSLSVVMPALELLPCSIFYYSKVLLSSLISVNFQDERVQWPPPPGSGGNESTAFKDPGSPHRSKLQRQVTNYQILISFKIV